MKSSTRRTTEFDTIVLSLFLLVLDAVKKTPGKLPCALLKSIREQSPQDDIQNRGGTRLSTARRYIAMAVLTPGKVCLESVSKLEKHLSKYEEPVKGAKIIDEAWLQEATRLCELALGGIKAMKDLVKINDGETEHALFRLGIELFNKTKKIKCEAGVLQVVAKVRFVCAEVLFFSGHDIKEVAKIYFSSGMKFIACHNNIMACTCLEEAKIKFDEYKRQKAVAYATVEDEVLRSEIQYAQAQVLVN